MTRRATRDDVLLVLHELRNPLVGIDAAARVLASELNGHPATPRARSIAAEARHLLGLLERVSEAEAVAAGAVRSVRRSIDLAAVVRGTAAEFERGRDVRISVPASPVIVRADPTRIRQVLANLLTNAAQYSPDGTPVDLTLRVSRGRATVSVRDRGPRIPARERSRLFAKFSRLSTADGTRGSGLGLYICKAIVDEHGGEIRYEDKEKAFEFTLQVAEGHGATSRPTEGPRARGRPPERRTPQSRRARARTKDRSEGGAPTRVERVSVGRRGAT